MQGRAWPLLAVGISLAFHCYRWLPFVRYLCPAGVLSPLCVPYKNCLGVPPHSQEVGSSGTLRLLAVTKGQFLLSCPWPGVW